jgi:hypothetical protein
MSYAYIKYIALKEVRILADIKIEDIISMFDEKIKELQIARKIFIEQFGKNFKESSEYPLFKETISETSRHAKSTKFGKTSVKEAIIKLLKERGSLKAKEIREITGIKRGTIGWLLGGNKDIFVSLGKGKWGLVDQKSKSLTS